MDEVPMDLSLCTSQIERFQRETGSTDIASYFRLPHRWIGVEMTGPDDPRSVYPRETLPERTSFDAWGVAHSAGSEAAYHMTRLHHPLRGATDPAEIDAYPMPRFDDAAETARLSERVRAIHQSGFATVAGLAQTVWESAWAIRSMEDLMVDMMSDDDAATLLLDRVTDVSRRRARIVAQAGCDIIQIGDDIGMQSTPMMSIDLWRDWLKPRLASVIDAARTAKPDIIVFYHSCGFVLPFIDDLIDIGVEVLNPIQPESMPFETVHRGWGDRLSFWGTIGTQSTLPFGTVADVHAAVRANVTRCGENGGIVIGPTHLVEPEVPWENIVALRDACDQLSPAR